MTSRKILNPVRLAMVGIAGLLLADQACAVGGQFGMEFAIDTPWRLEPHVEPGGLRTYGPIPITITFHDANYSEGPTALDDKKVGDIKEIRIVERTISADGIETSQTITLPASRLAHIERKRYISKPNQEPEREYCVPVAEQDCRHLFQISKNNWTNVNNEWHGLLWYQPTRSLPDQDTHLEVTVVTEAEAYRPVGQVGNNQFQEKFIQAREWTNFVAIHFSGDPLPRFSTSWLYGDLHYHSQMTDNEGESGYSYRNTVNTLGAMGLDFAFATEHASGGIQADQLLDKLIGEAEARDLNPRRFVVAKRLLYGAANVNQTLQLAASLNAIPRLRSAGYLPQIYMGEELDAIPTMSTAEQQSGVINYGHGQAYRWFNVGDCVAKHDMNLCRAKYSAPHDVAANDEFQRCAILGLSLEAPESVRLKRREACIAKYMQNSSPGSRRFRVLDTQGKVGPLGGEVWASRQHIVYFPHDRSTGDGGWISDQTSKFGGATRFLPSLAEEITRKGAAFLAHPADGPSPGSGIGPDIIPYSKVALDDAWAQPGIIGLQIWNENRHFREKGPTSPTPFLHKIGGAWDDRRKYIYHLPWFESTTAGTVPWRWRSNLERRLAFDGEPLVTPEGLPAMADIRLTKTNVEIFNGLLTWDSYLRKGLDPDATSALGWLPRSEPRKWFISAGSDGHGDFNFRREGRPAYSGEVDCRLTQGCGWSDSPVSDGAIGNPRNLVLVTTPAEPVPGMPNARRFSNQSVISALQAGRFSLTDGPALRIVVDKNRNGKADDGDLQMGSTFNRYPGEHIPIIVEWKSSPEFGRIKEIELFIGNQAETYADNEFGPARLMEVGNNALYPIYKTVPNLKFRLPVEDKGFGYKGSARFYISPQNFGFSGLPFDQENLPNWLYIRGQATTVAREENDLQWQDCRLSSHAKCGGRQAFTNPIWIRLATDCVVSDPNSADGNGNLRPDVCEAALTDPCASGNTNQPLSRKVFVIRSNGIADRNAPTLGRSCRVIGGNIDIPDLDI